MTLRQKVGQIIQGDIGSITPEDIKKYPLGSILNGGNSAPGGDYVLANVENFFAAGKAVAPWRIYLGDGVSSSLVEGTKGGWTGKTVTLWRSRQR